MYFYIEGGCVMAVKSDKMATWPVGKLLLSMSIPAMFSMMIQALYNIVDTMYISKISEDALFAVGIAFPFQMIIVSVSLGTAIGTSALIARKLGQQNRLGASLTAMHGVILAIGHSALLAIIGLLFSKTYLAMFTKDTHLIAMGVDYLYVVMTMAFGVVLAIFFERILQAEGNMMMPMLAQLLGAITNIILDPIFIFGYGFIPALGVRGAAIATVIGQLLSMVFIGYIALFGKHEISFKLEQFKLDTELFKEIYKIGVPVAIMNAMGSLAMSALNSVLVLFNTSYVAALSIYFKLQSFIYMPVFGMNQGSLPILSYNFGAQNKKQFVATLRLYIMIAVSLMVIGTVCFNGFTTKLVMIFNPSDHLLMITSKALKVASLAFPFAAFAIAMTTVFQSLGKSKHSMIMSILRQMVFLVPLVFLIGKTISSEAIWWAFPLAELLVVLIYIPIGLRLIHKAFE